MHYFEYLEGIDYPSLDEWINSEYDVNNNIIDKMISDIFHSCRLDDANYNTESWNPLSGIIMPGQTVLLKPNMVMDNNPTESDVRKGMDCLITHPSLVHTLFYFVKKALNGYGTIIVADAPIQGCDFEKLLTNSGYGVLFDYLNSQRTDKLNVICSDLRETVYKYSPDGNIQNDRDGIFHGNVIDLGCESYFADVEKKNRVRVTSYVGRDTYKHHTKNKNEYCISEAILQADVIISIPKPKTHRIAGYTAALKNMIGANARKEYLPHHRRGVKDKFGYSDEHDEKHRFLKYINSLSNDVRNWAVKNGHIRLQHFSNEIGRKSGRRLDKLEPNRPKFGMWYGNDTIWRTILDLNHIVYYADKDGNMCDSAQRNILYLGDMIVSGEGEGPLRPNYKKIGGLLFSDNPVEFDEFVVKIMGFDKNKIPTLFNATLDKDLSEICIVESKIEEYSNDLHFSGIIDEISKDFGFIPTSGWVNHIEK